MDQQQLDRGCAAHEHIRSICLRSFALFILVHDGISVRCKPVCAQVRFQPITYEEQMRTVLAAHHRVRYSTNKRAHVLRYTNNIIILK